MQKSRADPIKYAAAGFLLLAASLPATAQLFTPGQIRYMTADPNTDETVKECHEGASVKMQYFYHMLRPEGQIPACDPNKPRSEWCACRPPWLDQDLQAMSSKPVWQDPTEGVLSEAAIWQGPVSVLYEFFTTLQKCFPVDAGGSGIPPNQLMREFADNRTRFNMSLDRLYRARQGDSLDGRGRSILAHFELIGREYDSLMDGLIRSDTPAFVKSAIAIAHLSHMAYAELYARPRGGKPPKENPGAGTFMAAMLTAASVFLVFMAGLQLGRLNQDQLSKKIEEFWAKNQVWAQDFQRQFVAIKIQYLVLGPWIAMTLVGLSVFLSTYNFMSLIVFSGVGLYAGTQLPGWLLRQIRMRRGAQVERQLIDALTLLGNALKSGMDLVGGFRLVQKELLPPISEEFGLVIKNYELGTPFAKSLEGLEDRIQSRLLSYMVKAIVIQQQVGGNIIKIFDRIVENIREEAKLEEKTASLTAQQRIQSIVVGIMPWVMVGIMFIFQHKQMAAFYGSPIGLITMIFCIVWIAIGMKVVSSLGNVRV